VNYILLLILLVLVPTATATIITEVLFNEPGTQTTKEWVELYNPSAATQDLTGYTLTSSQNKTHTLGITLAPGSYAVIARNKDRFQEEWGFTPDEDGVTFTLKNSGDYVELWGFNGTVVDYVDWLTWNLTADDNKSIQRQGIVDTDTEGDWASNTEPTPGYGLTTSSTTTSTTIPGPTTTTLPAPNSTTTTTLPKILFTEVFYDTPGKDSEEEWVELINYGLEAVDLDNYTIEDNKASYEIRNVTVQVDETVVFATDRKGFFRLHSFYPDVSDFSLSLNNNGDLLTLKNPSGTILDQLAWESFNPGWDLNAKTGESLQRNPPTQDTDGPRDWITSAEPTPGSDQVKPKPSVKEKKTETTTTRTSILVRLRSVTAWTTTAMM
jgi:hypothetical protein